MMTELVLVEGVSDILLISYYLQKVYGWKSKNSNNLGITALEECEHIESLYNHFPAIAARSRPNVPVGPSIYGEENLQLAQNRHIDTKTFS